MKIKIELDVPEYVGGTDCDDCPFYNANSCCNDAIRKYCDKVDYSRMKILKWEEEK